MDVQRVEEVELVDAARGGDRGAFHVLYERNADTVYRYAAARVGPHEAEDVTAEVFCRAWTVLPRYEQRGRPFAAWLVRIARNLLISRARRTWPVLYDDTVRATSGDGSFEEHLVTTLMGEALREALEHLDDRHREVLRLRYLDGLSAVEAGQRLGLGDEAVRALTYRALRSLRARQVELGLADDGGA